MSVYGRGIAAQLTYLTILGSPSDSDKHRGQAGSGRDATKRDDQASRSDQKDQGSAQDRANKDRKDDHRSDEGSNGRRRVYQIAVRPKTEVCFGSSQGGQDSGGEQQDHARSAGERSQSDLEVPQLGDRVGVEFNPIPGQGESNSGGAGQASGGPQNRHGRHLIVHGVARKITVLSDSDRGDSDKSSAGRESGGSSSGDKESGSDAQAKKSDHSESLA